MTKAPTAPSAPSAKFRELRIRLLLGPTMLAAIAGLYALDVHAVAGRQGLLCSIVLGLLAIAGVQEFVAMMRRAGHAVAGGHLMAVTLALAIAAPFFGWESTDRELYPLVIGAFVLLFPIALRSLVSDAHMHRGLEEQGATLLGLILIAWPMYFAQGIALRDLPSLLYVVLVCKGGDIGGYLFGIAFGRHKLIPKVSAGKTIEGGLGSMLTAVVLAVVLRDPLLGARVPLGLTAAVLVGIMLNLTTQIGDLVESLLKRRCGVKDSSTLLPAHGGILDLVDSLLFSFPAWYLVLAIQTGP